MTEADRLRAENARLRAELQRLEQSQPSPYELLNRERWLVDEANRIHLQQQMKICRGGWPR